MTTRDEEYLFDCIEHIEKETHECNIMLRQICEVINAYMSRHHQENEDDFMRNVLANMVSSSLELKKIAKRQ